MTLEHHDAWYLKHVDGDDDQRDELEAVKLVLCAENVPNGEWMLVIHFCMCCVVSENLKLLSTHYAVVTAVDAACVAGVNGAVAVDDEYLFDDACNEVGIGQEMQIWVNQNLKQKKKF